MNYQKLQNFIDLITFDQNLLALESAITHAQQILEKATDQIAALQKKIEEKASTKRDLKKDFDLQELQVKDLQEKEQHQELVMQQAKNQKESEAAQKELDYIRANRLRHEKKLMNVWTAYQAAEKELATMQDAQGQQAQVLQQEMEQKQQELQMLHTQMQEQNAQREAKVALLSDDLLYYYDNMRGKVTNPVVPVLQDSCSACFYSISSKDLQLLRQEGLLRCKDCYRFLYIARQDQPADAKNSL